MEADEVTEEPHTIMDAKEHLSSKDPSAEDLLEPPISETPLEPSISQTPLEPHVSGTLSVPSTSQPPSRSHSSEGLLEPSVSETPLEPHSSEPTLVLSNSQILLESPAPESPLEPTTSQPLLESSTSESLLKPDSTEIPLEAPTSETYISKVLEKHLTFQSSSASSISMPSSNEVPQTRGPTQVPEFEYLPKDFLSGPSSQVHVDRSAKQKEEAVEDKQGVDTSDVTAHTAQPGHHVGKKKGKKGVSRHTSRPVVPAKQVDLVEVVKAMHRQQFGAQVKHLFQWEKDAALNAIQTGLYIGWRCPHYLWDCFRIGDESKCFCGHLLRQHQIISDLSVPCAASLCRCLMFCFIPSSPEEVGEFWLKRRATFDPKAWRAQCRCKHSHEEHAATGVHPCRHRGCCCNCFESNFLCAACDRRWEDHETFFETEETRRRRGRPHGTDYVPFAEMPVLQECILSNSDFEALQMQGLSGTYTVNKWHGPF